MKLLRNIAMVQINVKSGVDEYYLPKNVVWNDQQIDKLLLVAPTASILSPIDGTTPVLTASQVESLYLDLYTASGRDLAHGLSHEQILYNNDHPYLPGVKLSLDLSRLYFTETPTEDGCMLLYVYYGGKDVECMEEPQKSITVEFPLQANEQLSFTNLINTYAHVRGEKIRGISIWDADQKPVYLTLRDHQLTYVLQDVYSGLLRPHMRGATAAETQVEHAYLDSLDIDFEYSYIRNAMNAPTVQKITFEY